MLRFKYIKCPQLWAITGNLCMTSFSLSCNVDLTPTSCYFASTFAYTVVVIMEGFACWIWALLDRRAGAESGLNCLYQRFWLISSSIWFFTHIGPISNTSFGLDIPSMSYNVIDGLRHDKFTDMVRKHILVKRKYNMYQVLMGAFDVECNKVAALKNHWWISSTLA